MTCPGSNQFAISRTGRNWDLLRHRPTELLVLLGVSQNPDVCDPGGAYSRAVTLTDGAIGGRSHAGNPFWPR